MSDIAGILDRIRQIADEPAKAEGDDEGKETPLRQFLHAGLELLMDTRELVAAAKMKLQSDMSLRLFEKHLDAAVELAIAGSFDARDYDEEELPGHVKTYVTAAKVFMDVVKGERYE
jgi:hypothetical protein